MYTDEEIKTHNIMVLTPVFTQALTAIEDNKCQGGIKLNNYPMNHTIKTLAEAMQKNTKLEVFLLENTNLGPAHAPDLANMLVANHTLKSLCLSENQLGLEGVI